MIATTSRLMQIDEKKYCNPDRDCRENAVCLSPWFSV